MGVYVGKHEEKLERILVPPDRILGGQFVVGGIYATSPESVWVHQFHDSKNTLDHFDGSAWSTVWPPAGSDPDSFPRLGWTNSLWGDGEHIYFLSDGVLMHYARGKLEAILGDTGDGPRKVLDFWGKSSDEVSIVSRPPTSVACASLEVHRFDGRTLNRSEQNARSE